MGSTTKTVSNGGNSLQQFPVNDRKITVLGKGVYRGPHLFSDTPMVRLEVDLGMLEAWPTNKIPGFKEKLLAAVPSLEEHTCSYGERGGFLKRVEEGTWLGHVIEHVAIEFQNIADVAVSRGKTRSVKGRPGVYNVMFEYETEKVGLWAGRFAVELVSSLLPEDLRGVMGVDRIISDDDVEFTTVEDAIAHIRDVAGRERLGPTTRAIVEAAAKRGIPSLRLDDQSMVQLGWGKFQRRIRASITDATSQIAVEAAGDKALTKELLAQAGVPVPQGDVVRSEDGAVEAAEEVGYPVVVKPLDGNHGRGVTTNINTAADVRRAYARAREHSRDVVVEQFYAGRDFRVLVIDGKVVAVAERVPAHVIGDGKSTISQLVEAVNKDPRRGDGHEQVMTKIVVDAHVETTLARLGLKLDSIPPLGERVFLRDTANLSTGGTAIDRTDEMHPINIAHMERAARAIGLDIAGIDLVATDVSRPLHETHGGVVEVNAAPGFRMHMHPSEGRARPVGDAVISMLFPKDKPSRIPVAAITGTNGKSTTTRMLVNILRQKGNRVGFTSTTGVFIDDETIWEGDASGPQSARKLLRDTTIDYAVLETARGGILREGLAFESCDVGAVLNVTADHLGINGIHTLEDLAAVKSVVVESVRRNGVSVLNADDPVTRDLAEYAGGRVCFFSMNGGQMMSEHLRKHIAEGGLAVVRETWTGEEEIVIHAEHRRIPVINANKIPATLGGVAGFNVQNALAAIAIAHGLGVDIRTIAAGLGSFSSSYEQNPGRMNIFDGHGFRVILDYAHNPAALGALGGLIHRMQDGHERVIGMVSTPGDRRDEDIREMGRIAAQLMDKVVFWEDPDRRGRARGEILKLLKEGAIAAGLDARDITCVPGEEEAADICLRQAAGRDLVLLMPSDIHGIWQRMLRFRPAPPPLARSAARSGARLSHEAQPDHGGLNG
ncbi:MAG TPA: cyanophycin synthetase [Patescibacteria group bacterium]|nr:cyanophycin synthetase [Patescibacteria group bacterium]